MVGPVEGVCQEQRGGPSWGPGRTGSVRFQVNREIRCHRCYMHHQDCLCQEAPFLAGETRLGIMLHISEIFKSTATARFLPLAYRNTWLSFRGVAPGFDHPVYMKLQEHSPSLEELPASGSELVLFPGEDSVVLEPGMFADPVHLLVPDGNWNQAARMIHRLERFQRAKPVRLPGNPASSMPMRTQSKPGRVSTYEAVADALGILEGPETKERMLDFFRLMVQRHRATLGQEF